MREGPHTWRIVLTDISVDDSANDLESSWFDLDAYDPSGGCRTTEERGRMLFSALKSHFL